MSVAGAKTPATVVGGLGQVGTEQGQEHAPLCPQALLHGLADNRCAALLGRRHSPLGQGQVEPAGLRHAPAVNAQHRVVGALHLIEIIPPDPGDNIPDTENTGQSLPVRQGHRHLPARRHPLDGDLRSAAQGEARGLGQGLGDQFKGGHQENNPGKHQQDAQVLQPPSPQGRKGIVEDVQMLAQTAAHQFGPPVTGRPGFDQNEPVGKCSMAPGWSMNGAIGSLTAGCLV